MWQRTLSGIILLVLPVVALLVGCQQQPATSPSPTVTPTQPSTTQPALSPVVLQSEKQRITSPSGQPADLALLADGNSAFAFDLYQVFREQNDNLFYSPYSISVALAMTYAGARGKTAEQMADTLHYLLPQDRLHPAFNSLQLELGKRGKGAKGKEGEGFRLNITNALWPQVNYRFLATFLDVMAENYGAGLRPLDFAKAPEESRVTINNWVSEQTEGRIKDLIPKDAISTLTRLVLTNAIYFNAAWQYPFNVSATKDGPFYRLDGSTVVVPMMKQTKSLGYAEGDGYQAVELPYDGNELSMVILLPKADQFKAFEEVLDSQRVAGIIKSLRYQQVALTMPRFTYDSKYLLGRTLSRMGMPDALLSGIADFSGMDGTLRLFIGEVIHQAFIAVDEAGTEAAAATAVVIMPMARPPTPTEPKQVTIDHPFIFMIRDIKTGTILFVGRVVSPSLRGQQGQTK